MTCDICYKRLTVAGEHVPKVFPCGHSYCSKCMASLFKHSSSCPKCRIRFSFTNPEALPKNFKLMEVLEEEKRKSKLRKQQEVSSTSWIWTPFCELFGGCVQEVKDNEKWHAFEELALQFCSHSQKLVEVFGELEQEHHRTIINKELEKLRCLSVQLTTWQLNSALSEKDAKGGGFEGATKKLPNRRSNSRTTLQAKQRWRY